MATLPLSPHVFAILRHLIEERLGIDYSSADLDVLAGKVTPRVIERGFDNMMDYYYFLRYDAGGEAELVELAEALVVNETYFFREQDSLRVLCDTLITPMVKSGVRPRIWSAACSTGEEPLTLAMLLDERDLLGRVELMASDISHRALERARSGQFRGRSFRALPPSAHQRWFRGTQESAAIDPRILASVRWQRINLLEENTIAALGKFDVVLCRNLLIYFRDAVATGVVGHLTAALRPGGLLLVGVSETLLRIGTSLSCEEHGGSFFYRKAP